MKRINIYLDDLRTCPNNYTLAKTVAEAIFLIKSYDINILSLDHDLGLDAHGVLEKTGYDLVKQFCEEGLFAKEIRFHTANPVGRENMVETLITAQKRGFISKDIRIVR